MDTNYGTHQPVLLEVLKRITGPVLELGSGHFSTAQIHKAISSKIITVDDNQSWVEFYKDLQTDNHQFLCYPDDRIKEFYDSDNETWSLVFVDNSTWVARAMAIEKYKDTADFVIIHDCDFISRAGYFGRDSNNNPDVIDGKRIALGNRDYSDLFKSWIEFFPEYWTELSPPTLIGSNKIDLTDFEVEGMIISGRK
jgi:hypothetical protein